MNLQHIPPNQLNPAPYNPRQRLLPESPAYRRLSRSIDEFDLVQPIVWNERTGHVVAGHQRLEIAKARRRPTVPCVVIDLPLEREKALNIALNNPALGSDWDEIRLQDLLLELQDAPDIDATLTGFDADELQDLLLQPAPIPTETEPDNPDERVRVTLIIPPNNWDAIRPALDKITQQYGLELHVRLPESGGLCPPQTTLRY